MPAAKKAADSAASPVEEHLAAAETAAESTTGVAKVLHHLDVAFVHALAGAKEDAHKSIDAADEEISRFAPNLSHLQHDFALLKARVHAALSRK